MSLADTRQAQMFPMHTPAQIATARRFASGEALRYAAGETLSEAGQRDAPAFLMLAGEVAITGGDGAAHSLTLTHGPGQITGEISQLAGRPSLAAGRAGADGCLALPSDAPHLRAMLIGSAELGELLMRALILRRPR